MIAEGVISNQRGNGCFGGDPAARKHPARWMERTMRCPTRQCSGGIKTMATVRDLLKLKGDQVWSVAPATSVLDALALMSEKNVGALLVQHNDQMVGIISERDFARSIAKTGRCIIEAPVEDYMTREVFTVDPDLSTDECMTLMTEKRIRHLPVVVESKLIGLISIGDVVKDVISAKESTILILESYIEGKDYAR
jgi:CBS domain-containing protein